MMKLEPSAWFIKEYQVCSSQRLCINALIISDQMIINLNYSDVQDYKETVGITYSGELRRLVEIEFPDEMEAETHPTIDEDVDTALEDGLEADSDDSGSDREDYSSEEGEEEEEESE